MNYQLYYWGGIPGRGEFVRLALEEADAPYEDVARADDGEQRMLALLGDKSVVHAPFAPPFLKAGKLLIGQTANILFYLGERHDLAPKRDPGRLWTQQLQLTLADLVGEVHDTHHPIAGSLYYEDQRPEAKRRADDFLANRLPKFLAYFERALASNPSGPEHLVGARVSYADLSLFHVVAGLRYAFPNAMSRSMPRRRNIAALAARIAERPRIAAYLASDRRLPFNEQGIFRHYPELDR